MRSVRFLTALLALLPAIAGAQNLEIVHTFAYPKGNPRGELLPAADGSFFGTAQNGGNFSGGSVFRMTPDGIGGYSIEELHSFEFQESLEPLSGLVPDASGWMYGTTSGGGGDYGSVFAVDPQGHVTLLHRFDNSDGAQPRARLVLAPNGFLYGAAHLGGTNDNGTVFRCDRFGNFETLRLLDGGADGLGPSGLATDPSGTTFWGVTLGGGANMGGTVFRIDRDGSFHTVHDFDFSDGAYPRAPLVLGSDGNFYGTASAGGENGAGTVFRVTQAGLVSPIYSFESGAGPILESPLLETSPGVFVGTTESGGLNNLGKVYQVTTAGAYAVLHDFDIAPEAGHQPVGGLILSGGTLYGTTRTGGADDIGAVYRIDPDGANYEVLASMPDLAGGYPTASLVQASDGNIYGSSSKNGATTTPLVFRIDGSDAFEILKPLAPTEGLAPLSAFTEGPDGALYAVAEGGGAHLMGTVIRLDPASTGVTVLHDFDGTDGLQPRAGLLLASDDLLYGAAVGGGDNSLGTLFRIDTKGTFSKLWDFTGDEGASPNATLTEGGDHFFYGSASGGGGGTGTIFRLDPGTGVTSVRDMQATDGNGPIAQLVEFSPGSFYGTAAGGGTHLSGTLFQVDIAGELTVLYDFDTANFVGADPQAGVIQASDGDFYGTTEDGGFGGGTVYRLANGAVSAAYVLSSWEGFDPKAALIEATDGTLYGTAYGGGSPGRGTVFRVLLGSAPDPTVTSVEPASGPARGGTALIVRGTHFQAFPSVTIAGTTFSTYDVDSRTIHCNSHPAPPGTLQDVSVMNSGGAATGTLSAAFFVDFLDVPGFHLFHDYVESIVRTGITAGCGNGNYCVSTPATRAQMAVFLLKSEHGSSYTPPPCGGVFPDVPCPSQFADWIEQLAAEGITGGCGGGNFCPDNPVTRAQMAIFLLKTLLGSSYTPPGAVGIFGDVPVGSFAADWIEDLYGREITGGCSAAPLLYCPNNPNTRGQMAVFLSRTFNLQ